jgi:transglutaminase-like putative cysteine protease
MNMTLVTMLAFLVSANHTFDINTYNCWDYSTDLVAMIHAENISARIIVGTVDCGKNRPFKCVDYNAFQSAHAWVEVGDAWIESTTGRLVLDRATYHKGYYSHQKYRIWR